MNPPQAEPDTERCMWCQGEFACLDGPAHEYIESTPGCWAAYTELLARDYENFQELKDVHRLVVDTYAVQHPGQPSRRSIQSVWTHLISLHFALEYGGPSADTWRAAMRTIEAQKSLHWLDPPDFTGTLTVADVLQAEDLEHHKLLVRQWAESVRDAWAATLATDISWREELNIDHRTG